MALIGEKSAEYRRTKENRMEWSRREDREDIIVHLRERR